MKMKQIRRVPLGFGPVDVPEVTSWDEVTSIGVSYETDPEMLKKILPAGAELTSPNVYVYQHTYKGSSLLAGRGYNLFAVALDAKNKANIDTKNIYVAVRFIADQFAMIDTRYHGPGFPDLYADVIDPVRMDGNLTCYASMYSHTFVKLHANNLKPATSEQLEAFKKDMSRQHWIVEEGDVFLPTQVKSLEIGDGTCEWFATDWQETPSNYHIAEFFRSLPVKKWNYSYKWIGSMQIEPFDE